MTENVIHPVVFDTSILRKLNPVNLSPEYRLLLRLQEAGKLELVASMVVYGEWFSQLTLRTRSTLDKLRSVLRSVEKDPSIDAVSSDDLLSWDSKTGEAAIDAIEEKVERRWSLLLMRAGLNIDRLELDDAEGVFRAYFCGDPPFKDVKNGTDIPDAFIFQALSRRKKAGPVPIFVCEDAKLSKSAKELGCIVVNSLEELLKLDEVRLLSADHKFGLWWESNYKNVASLLKDEEDLVIDEVSDAVLEVLEGVEIHDHRIPEDNSSARIRYADGFREIELNWDEADSVGEGVLSVPVSFIANMELDFFVYKADAFDVPDWVHVSLGDLELDHYFDAEATVEGLFHASVSIEINSSVQSDNLDLNDLPLVLKDVEFVQLIGVD